MVELSKTSSTDENMEIASAIDVIERPATGVVLTIVSGQRAGEMIGTDENEFFIGYHPDCFVRFSPSQYPDANARLLFRRSREGWCVTQVSGDPAFVNQRLADGKVVLRSGDIVRLSALGPDVQFTLQSGGLAVKSLVHRFLAHELSQTPVAVPNISTGNALSGIGSSVSSNPGATSSVVAAVPALAVSAMQPTVQDNNRIAAVMAVPVQAPTVEQPATTPQSPRAFASEAAKDVMNAVRRKPTIAGLPIWLALSAALLVVTLVVLLIFVVSRLL